MMVGMYIIGFMWIWGWTISISFLLLIILVGFFKKGGSWKDLYYQIKYFVVSDKDDQKELEEAQKVAFKDEMPQRL